MAMLSPLTLAQRARIAGFQANLSFRGRQAVTDSGEKLLIIVEDIPDMSDPDRPAQAKVPVWARVHALGITFPVDPRTVKQFIEAGGGRTFYVREYLENPNVVSLTWRCEVQRQ